MLAVILLTTINCLFRLGQNEQERIISVNHVKFLKDSTRALTFDQVQQYSDSLFKFDRNFEAKQYDIKAAYWIEFTFCIEEGEDQYMLEFFDQTIDTVSLYLQKDNGQIQSWQFGDQYPFSQKPFSHKNFQVNLSGAGQYQVYARIASQHYADIRISIKTINRFIKYAINEYYLYGIFYGMILIISLYNLTIYTAIREIKYLYYTFYILSVGLFAMCVDGIAYQYLWPGMPKWNHIAHGVMQFSLIFWSIVFSKRFLRPAARAPKIDQLLNWILGFRTALFLYALFIDQNAFNYRYIEVIPLSVIFYGSILVLNRGYKPARFFIIAYGFLFTGFLIKALLALSIIPLKAISNSEFLQIVTYYSLHISFVFEMLFLSLALSDRVRILKETRDRAQNRIIQQHESSIRYKDMLNAQLEQKIQERTVEIREKNDMLQTANQTLEKQKHDISQINSMLDLDNWKLRNNIKSLQKERLINKRLDYEEFKGVFTSNKKCLEFLANHKWRHGYKCSKCANSKYLHGAGHCDRRCSKCGYNESPTAGSLFHAMKFPLVKGFYLLYLFVNQDKTSQASLAQKLNLRKSTVSSFEKRIRTFSEKYGPAELDIFKDLAIDPAAQRIV